MQVDIERRLNYLTPSVLSAAFTLNAGKSLLPHSSASSIHFLLDLPFLFDPSIIPNTTCFTVSAICHLAKWPKRFTPFYNLLNYVLCHTDPGHYILISNLLLISFDQNSSINLNIFIPLAFKSSSFWKWATQAYLKSETTCYVMVIGLCLPQIWYIFRSKQIHLNSSGPLKTGGKITFNNSAVHCPTLLKFTTVCIYGSPENDLRFGRPPQVAVHC